MTDMATKIARIETNICWVKKMLENHLMHHWYITLAACTTSMGAIGALIIFLLKRE